MVWSLPAVSVEEVPVRYRTEINARGTRTTQSKRRVEIEETLHFPLFRIPFLLNLSNSNVFLHEVGIETLELCNPRKDLVRPR